MSTVLVGSWEFGICGDYLRQKNVDKSVDTGNGYGIITALNLWTMLLLNLPVFLKGIINVQT